MGIDERIKTAVVDVVRKRGQPRKLSDRLGSLLDFLADNGSTLGEDGLERRMEDVLEVVKLGRGAEEKGP